jgi:methyl-accepting chemotaxis protein WspA
MMKSLTIRTRIVVSFAVVLALMAVMATFAYTRLQRIHQLTTLIEADILPGLASTDQILVERIANYSLTQEYVLQTDPAIKQRLKAAILSSRAYMDTLGTQYAPSVSTPDELALFDAFKAAQAGYVAAQDEVLAASDAKSRDEGVKRISQQLYPEFATAGSAAGAMLDHQKAEAAGATGSASASVSSWR